MPRLVVISGPDLGKTFVVADASSLLIGRGRECADPLNDPGVSRTHCEVSAADGRVLVRDAQSSSGTFVGGQRISEHTLVAGDVIQIGATQLRYEPDVGPQSTILDPPDAADPAAAVALSVLMGQQIGTYRLEQVVAPSPTGMVFFGRDVTSEREVAVKVLPPQFSENEEQRQRFVRAMKTMLAIRHENIVEIYDAGTFQEYAWVAMEYVPGESLAHMIERHRAEGSSDWREAFRMACHVARALREAWLNDIIHRNLTPTGILHHTAADVYKLGDLMLAKAVEGDFVSEVSVAGQMVGNVCYMSPERTRSQRDIDCRSDLYELGAATYALLTGHPPFEAASVVQLVQAVRRSPPERLSGGDSSIPEDFDAVVRRLLEKSPDDRFQNPLELLEELGRVGETHGLN